MPCRPPADRTWRLQELKAKLQELEGDQRSRTIAVAALEATIAVLESKLRNLDEQLEGEAKERLLQAKANRKLEKRYGSGDRALGDHPDVGQWCSGSEI